MIFITHYYPAGTFSIKSTEDRDNSSLWLVTHNEQYQILRVVMDSLNPVEVTADCVRTMDKSTRAMRGVLKYHSLRGDLNTHLLFQIPTDLYVWDLSYKAFNISVPPFIKDMLNMAEGHTIAGGTMNK